MEIRKKVKEHGIPAFESNSSKQGKARTSNFPWGKTLKQVWTNSGKVDKKLLMKGTRPSRSLQKFPRRGND